MGRALDAFENDDRDLTLGETLLLREVWHRGGEVNALLRRRGGRPDLEAFGTQLHRRGRSREQVLIPGPDLKAYAVAHPGQSTWGRGQWGET